MTSPMGPPPRRPARYFVANEILSGQVRLDGFPFRYIVIGASRTAKLSTAFGGRAGFDSMIDIVLTAVEFLETSGWELVCLDQGGTLAFMRRRAHS